MKAIVWHDAGDLRLEDVPAPEHPGAHEAIIEVAYCGICGTDLHEYRAGPVMIRPSQHPLTGAEPPIVLGHEFSGVIAGLGDAVEGFVIGQRVTVDPCWRCGRCYWCLRGDYQICRYGGSVGLASNGALAPFVRVPSEGLVALPDGVDDRVAALTEPLAVGLHAARRAGVAPGDAVMIQGFGPVGAAVLLAVQAMGASGIHVVEPQASRRDLALRLGATEAYDPAAVDARREIYLRTGRRGPDAVVECTGRADLIGPAVSAARRGGRIVLVGIGHGVTDLDPREVTLKEREVIGSLGYNHDLPRVVDLIASGRIDPGPLITGIVPLEEGISGAFDALSSGTAGHMKILIDVKGSS